MKNVGEVVEKLSLLSGDAIEFATKIKSNFGEANNDEIIFIGMTLLREAILDIKHQEKVRELQSELEAIKAKH